MDTAGRETGFPALFFAKKAKKIATFCTFLVDNPRSLVYTI